MKTLFDNLCGQVAKMKKNQKKYPKDKNRWLKVVF